jgi:hypothetical protein
MTAVIAYPSGLEICIRLVGQQWNTLECSDVQKKWERYT